MTKERRHCSIHDVFQGGLFLCHRCHNSWSTRRNRISRQNSGADSHSYRRDSDSAGSGGTGRNLKAFSPRTGFNCFVSFSHCCVLHVVSTVKVMKNSSCPPFLINFSSVRLSDSHMSSRQPSRDHLRACTTISNVCHQKEKRTLRCRAWRRRMHD